MVTGTFKKALNILNLILCFNCSTSDRLDVRSLCVVKPLVKFNSVLRVAVTVLTVLLPFAAFYEDLFYGSLA